MYLEGKEFPTAAEKRLDRLRVARAVAKAEAGKPLTPSEKRMVEKSLIDQTIHKLPPGWRITPPAPSSPPVTPIPSVPPVSPVLLPVTPAPPSTPTSTAPSPPTNGSGIDPGVAQIVSGTDNSNYDYMPYLLWGGGALLVITLMKKKRGS